MEAGQPLLPTALASRGGSRWSARGQGEEEEATRPGKARPLELIADEVEEELGIGVIFSVYPRRHAAASSVLRSTGEGTVVW
jgi:hypothetical protein